MTGRALRARRPGGDRGASTIELVLYTPLLMLVIFVAVQTALTWHGNEVAGAVAREAARVARTGGGTPAALDQARAVAADYAEAIGGSALTEVQVEVTSLAATQEVRVTVQGPVEVFRPDA